MSTHPEAKVRVGIVGWGNIARTLHERCLSEMDEFELLAACDPDPAQLDDVRERCGCAVYRDMEAFLEHPGLDLRVAVCHGRRTISSSDLSLARGGRIPNALARPAVSL